MSKSERRKSILEKNKFYETTEIAGFAQISNSNSRLEAVIWYTVVITFFILTVIGVTNVTMDYLSRPTKTTVSILNFNESYVLKNFRLDLKIGVPGYNPEFSNTRYSRLLHSNGTVLEPATNKSVFEEVQEAILKLKTADKIKTSKWPYGLMPLFDYFTIYMSFCESGSCLMGAHDTTLINATYKFIEHAAKLGINQHQLLQIYGKELLRLCKFTWWKENWWLTGVNIEETDYFGPVAAVYNFELMSEQGRRAKIDAEHNYYQWIMTVDLDALFKGYMDIIGTKDLVDGVEWYNQKYSPYIKVSNFGRDEKISFRADPSKSENVIWGICLGASYHLFQSIHKGGIPSCKKNDKNVQACQFAAANKRLAIPNCNCVMTFTYESPIICDNVTKFCTIEQYINCTQNLEGLSVKNVARTYKYDFKRLGDQHHCNRLKCEVQFFQTYHIQTVYPRSYRGRAATITIRILPTEYPAFVEELEQTLTDYLANLGGAFDLWIGASIIGVLHVVVYFTKQVIYVFQKRTKTGQNVRSVREKWRTKEPFGEMITSLTMSMVAKQEEPESDQLTQKVDWLLKSMESLTERVDSIESLTRQITDIQQNLSQRFLANEIRE